MPSSVERKLAYVSSLGERIKLRRLYLEQARGIEFPQAELARQVGVERSSVSQWENGSTKSLKAEHLLDARDALATTVDWLVRGRDPRCDTDGNIISDNRTSLLEPDSITMAETYQSLPPAKKVTLQEIADSFAQWSQLIRWDGTQKRRKGDKQSGFSLIEIAIVLVIAGLLLSAVLPLMTAQRTNAAISATRTKGEAIVTALMSFVARNHRLPCPAIATIAPNTPGYGVEETCADEAPIPVLVLQGIVPWISLGLTNEQGSDAYHRRFTYFVRQQETSRIARRPDTISAMRGNMTIHSGAPIGAGLKSPTNPAGNQVNSCDDSGDNNCNLDAVVVIISHGANGLGAFLETGGQMDAPIGAFEPENADNNLAFIDAEYSSSDTDPFDDMLIALDPDDILRPLAKDGSIPSALAVTMDRMNLIRQVLIGRIVNAELRGETPSIPPGPLPPVPPIPPIPPPPGPPQDGWGMPFSYVQGSPATARLNVCGAPPPPSSTPTFTITSRGVDQDTGTGDDIIVSQNNDQVKFIIQLHGPPPCPTPPCPPCQ